MPDPKTERVEAALARLSSLRWPKRAAAVPDSAGRLALAPSEAARRAAMFDVLTDVADQGVVDALFARATPALLDLSLALDDDIGAELLARVVDLGLDGHVPWLRTGFHPERDGEAHVSGPGTKHFKACHGHLRSAEAGLVDALASNRRAMRSAAAFACAWLGERADALVPVLGEALRGELEPSVAANLCVALGLLGRHAGDASEAHDRLEDARDRLVQAGSSAQLEGAGAGLAQAGTVPYALGAHVGLVLLDETDAPLDDPAFQALLAAYRRPTTTEPEPLLFAVHDRGFLLDRLLKEAARRDAVLEACEEAAARRGDHALHAARALLEARLGARPALDDLDDEQRVWLRGFLDSPVAARPHAMANLGLPRIEEARAALGMTALGAASQLDVPLVVGDWTGTARRWAASEDDTRPHVEALVPALVTQTDAVALLLEAERVEYVDPLRDALAALPAAEAWPRIHSLADRLLDDRGSLPEPRPGTPDVFPRRLLYLAGRFAARASEADAVGLDRLMSRLHDAGEYRALEDYLRALPAPLAEPRVLELMARDTGTPARFAEACPSPAVAAVAVTQIEAFVRGGGAKVRGRTPDQRANQQRRQAAAFARALGGHELDRVATLASATSVVGGSEGRGLFVRILVESAPASAAQLARLLGRRQKGIREMALEGLRRCPHEVVDPLLEALERSKTKALREAAATLRRER